MINDTITENVQKANQHYLYGWWNSEVYMTRLSETVHNKDIDDMYNSFGKFIGVGFEEAVNHYERANLDEPENSDKWWEKFNASND